MFKAVVLAAALVGAGAPARAPAHDSVFVEDLTWTELAALVRAGRTTVIIPVGGVEQSGPHIALGKHDVRVRVLSERVARGLGDALVAPVVAYVPEGGTATPTGHMRFPGTITVPPAVFRQSLESAAASFRLHGFRDVVLIGDHGGYQADLKTVAEDLNRAWKGSPARAHYIAAYYQASSTGFAETLKRAGHPAAEIGNHAGLADTALILAVDPRLVRRPAAPRPGDGVSGDPRRATAALGRLGTEAIVTATIRAIRAEVHPR